MYNISFFGVSYASQSSFEAVADHFYLGLDTYKGLVNLKRYGEWKLLKLLEYRETADTITILAIRKNRVWKIALDKANKNAIFDRLTKNNSKVIRYFYRNKIKDHKILAILGYEIDRYLNGLETTLYIFKASKCGVEYITHDVKTKMTTGLSDPSNFKRYVSNQITLWGVGYPDYR